MMSSEVPVRNCAAGTLCVLAAFVLVGTAPLIAQPPDADSAEGQNSLSNGLPLNRRTASAVEQLSRHLDAGEFEEADRVLRLLQAAEPEVIVPSQPDSTVYVPLFRRVHECFHRLPSPIRQAAIERTSEPAERALQNALADGIASHAGGIVLRYPGTESAGQVQLLMARLHQDRGNRLAAISWLNPLLQAGVAPELRRLAENLLKGLQSHAANSVSASDVDGDSADDASLPVIPEFPRWQQRPDLAPQLQQAMETFLSAAADANATPATTWKDLVDGTTLFRRTSRGILAMDPESGEPRWHLPDTSVRAESFLPDPRALRAGLAPDGAAEFGVLEHSLLSKVFCQDTITPGLTVDSHRLYFVQAVKGTDPMSVRAMANPVFMARNGIQSPESRLVAVDRATGRRLWTAGATMAAEDAGQASLPVWFAGAPTVSRQQVLIVYERNGELRLGCLAADRGEQLWSAVLSFPENSIQKDLFRQLCASQPLADEGLIWVQTQTGWLMCVDEAIRGVVWASRLSDSSQPQQSQNFIRRGLFSARLPATPSLREHWNTSAIVRSENRLTVLSQQGRALELMDAISGQLLKTVPVGFSPMVIHADDQCLVSAEREGEVNSAATRLICRDLRTGETRWDIGLPTETGRPTGSGTERSGCLLIPMSSGAVMAVRLKTGEVAARVERVLPVNSWGCLLDARDERALLFSAPDRLLRISDRAKELPGPEGVLELASALAASGKWLEALKLADGLKESGRRATELKALQFECRLQLARETPETYLAILKDSAETGEQRREAAIVEADILVRQQKDAEAVPLLLSLLNDSHSRQRSDAEISKDLLSAVAVNDELNVRPTVQGWAGLQVGLAIDRLAETSDSLSPPLDEQLKQLSVGGLLSLQSPTVIPELHRRLTEETSDENALQLLLHVIELRLAGASPGAVDLTAEARLFGDRWLTRAAEKSADNHSVAERAGFVLLNVVAQELPSAFRAALQSHSGFSKSGLKTLDELRQEHRETVLKSFEGWAGVSYQTIPVARTLSYRHPFTLLTPAESQDPFLSQYDWRGSGGDLGRIQASELPADRRRTWSLSGNFHLFAAYSNSADVLYRCGSVVVLKTQKGLTAMSVLDRRVLWTRDYPASRSGAVPYDSGRNFEVFHRGQQPLPSEQNTDSVSVVGLGRNWLAVAWGSHCEVIQAMTGSVFWTADVGNASAASSVTATNAGVVVHQDGARTLLNLRTGAVLKTEAAADSDLQIVRSQGDHLVCWQRGRDGAATELQWVDPMSGDVTDRISLSNLNEFHFVDDGLLAGFGSDGLVRLINLREQSLRDYHCDWGPSQNPASGASAEGPASESDSDKSLPSAESPDHAFPGLQVAVDSVMIYLSVRPAAPMPATLPPERRLVECDGRVIALDRDSGEVRWQLKRSSPVLLATDQPDFPVLVVIESQAVPANAAAGQTQNTFLGISRTTGERLFEQKVPTQYGLRQLWLTADNYRTVDLGVHGLRLRFDGASQKAAAEDP
ncbi:MAG: PQQ-binding-like beta-propeller repeat protein [Planctomycetaceae bacterium]